MAALGINMDPYMESRAAAERIHERARYLRGRFLNSVAVIERKIGLILTNYFCTPDEDKQHLFFTRVIGAPAFSLNSKKDVLVRIVKSDYPQYWSDNQEWLKALNKIMEFRNKLAHSVVDVSEEALRRPIEAGIGLIEWKDGEPITDSEFEEWEVKANMVSSCLNDIERLLPYKQVTNA